MSIHLYIVVLLLLTASCSKDKYANDTHWLNDYLETTQNITIPDDTTYFVVIAEHGCIGCIEMTVDALKDNGKTKFVVSNDTYAMYLAPRHIPRSKYLLDTTGILQRLKFHHYNVGVVQCARRKIYNEVQELPYSKADSILATIR